MAKGYKRRDIFVDKELQGKMIFQFFLFTVFIIVCMLATSAYISSDHLTIAYDNDRIQVNTSAMIVIKDMLQANWIVMLTAGIGLTIFLMIVTLRIAGPLYRFKLTLTDMNNRNLDSYISLRTKDEGKELAEKFNTFNEMLTNDLIEIDRYCNSLKQHLGNESFSEDDSVKMNEDVQHIQSLVNSYKRKR